MNDAINTWLSDPAIAEADKREIRELVERRDDRELADRFYRDLEFGTGGMRGLMGAGRNRMNIYTVGAAAQGLAAYIAKQGDAAKRGGAAIAYDCRHNSDVFAKRVATVLAANGITAYLFEAPRPTPQLSFAVRHLKCTAGVVVTASHNPPAYNGFKCYWSDGCQVTPPHDKAIIEDVRHVGAFANIKTVDYEDAVKRGNIKVLGVDLDEAFLDAVDGSCLNRAACRSQGAKLKIVFTALHGTGGALAPEALRRRGFEHVLEVPQQAKCDGAFPTVKSPNPEEGEALHLAIELAKREHADLVIGTDPDADRAGIAVRAPDGSFTLLTGNQTAALLTHYLCDERKRMGTLPKDGMVLTTIVSSDLMKEIGRHYGAEVVETLTGFKWIGEKIRQYDEARSAGGAGKSYIFGAEESYGYMPCTFTRDKDAITSTAFIAEAAAVAASRGQTLLGVLDELYRTHGYFQEGARSITMPGKDGAEQIVALMQRLRSNPPQSLGNRPVVSVTDMQTGLRREVKTGVETKAYELPASDVLIFQLDDGTKMIVRPSGTEPKIKFYILAKEAGADLAKARSAATSKIQAISKDIDLLASPA